MDSPKLTAKDALIGNRLTIREIAADFGCSDRAVYSLVSARSIPYVKVLGKRYYDPALVKAAIEQGERLMRGKRRAKPVRMAAAEELGM